MQFRSQADGLDSSPDAWLIFHHDERSTVRSLIPTGVLLVAVTPAFLRLYVG
ncbi:MAG: hypothetical protein HY314_07410 [Acidobacteria bacterium]|nr:hypothetical protein [Acidobacteriota bacterium]